MCVCAGGARQGHPRRQPGRRGDVPPGHRAPPGERRGLLAARAGSCITMAYLHVYEQDYLVDSTLLYRRGIIPLMYL